MNKDTLKGKARNTDEFLKGVAFNTSASLLNGLTMGSTVPINEDFLNLNGPRSVEFGLSTGGGVSSDVSVAFPVGKPVGKIFGNKLK